MYGFGGVGQVEVRFGEMSPWWDNQPNNKERQGYSANGLWKAEMSKNTKHIYQYNTNINCKKNKKIQKKNSKKKKFKKK